MPGMSLRALHKRLGDLIAENDANPSFAERNDKLEAWVSFQMSTKRKVYLPVTAVWGGWLTIPKPDDNTAGYKEDVHCFELRADIQDKVTVKN